MCSKISNVTVIGAGTQGSMIAFRNAFCGKKVVIFDLDSKQIENALLKIAGWFDKKVEKGLIEKEKVEGCMKNISTATELAEAVKDADLVIENVPERLELKQKVWAQIDQASPEKTIMTTNSSSLKCSSIFININEERKPKTFNLNFTTPTEENFLEVMWNEYTSEETKKSVLTYLEENKQEPLITEKEIKGFSINRVWRAIKKECLKLWANGYTIPSEFDRAFKEEWDSKMGPYEFMDMVGLDVVYDIEMSYYSESQNPDDIPPEKLLEWVKAGRLGVKSGEGFYKH